MRCIPQKYPQYIDEGISQTPHHVCGQFLEWFDMKEAKKYINHWLKAVYKSASWSLGPPGDLLYFYECLLQLVEGTWLVNRMDNNSDRLGNISAISDDEKFDIMHPSNYCRLIQAASAFDYFPRNLSALEFINPYLVFDKFFKYRQLQDWRDMLYDLFRGALTNHDMEHMGTYFDLVRIKRHLDKLVEASHLISIREFIRENGKWKEIASYGSPA